MSTIINGSSPSITFSDSTTQASAGLTAASPTIASGVLTFPDATTQSSGSGVAKAWVNFNGAATPPTISASYNVSSVTRSSTGIFVITLTNAMSSANYGITIGVAKDNSTNDGNFYATIGCNSVVPTASTIPLTTTQGYGGSLSNSSLNCVAVFK